MPKISRKPQRSEELLARPPALPSGRELEIGLADLGLSEREARLYVAMLSKPDSTSIELHRMANISRKKIYEVLSRMIERKLCIERQVGRTKRYTPVDPELLADTRAQQMTAQLSQIQKLKHELSRLYEARDGKTVSLEYLETLQTHKQLKERIAYLSEKCRDEALSFSTFHPLIQSFEEADRVTLQSVRRTKDVRTVYEFGPGIPSGWMEHVIRWHEAGEKSRFIHKLPTKMLVYDGLHVLLVIQDALGPGQEATVLFSNRGLALAFRKLFEYVWNEAIPFEQFMAHHKEIVKGHVGRRA
jgi:sugar-specific transcriptional regulator TrmB